MTPALDILSGGAAAVAFMHTAIGIDHTLPFLVIGKAQGWSLRKVLGMTALCGVAHVLSSLVLGITGVALGISVQRFQIFQAVRGDVAAWALIAFGLTYAAWSFAKSRRLQRHLHQHHDGDVHAHDPADAHSSKSRLVTAWSLFIIFVLGPCEPLIPLIMVPALSVGIQSAAQVALVFSLTTIGTMLVIVTAGYFGLNFLPLKRLQTHANTLAGLAVAVSGLAIQLFGI
jgi:nickel/cobalt transporter (NicO) family protein